MNPIQSCASNSMALTHIFVTSLVQCALDEHDDCQAQHMALNPPRDNTFTWTLTLDLPDYCAPCTVLEGHPARQVNPCPYDTKLRIPLYRPDPGGYPTAHGCSYWQTLIAIIMRSSFSKHHRLNHFTHSSNCYHALLQKLLSLFEIVQVPSPGKSSICL